MLIYKEWMQCFRGAGDQCSIVSLSLVSRFEVSSYRPGPSEYSVQMETEEEREALILSPGDHVVVRKVSKGKLLNP